MTTITASARLHALSFDLSRAFGTLHDDERVECTVSQKMISFENSGCSIAYDQPVQLCRLDQEHSKHVVSFEFLGMVQEYGFNAIAIVLSAEDATLKLSDNLFVAYSQGFAPFASSWITLYIDMKAKVVTLFAEPLSSLSSKKRAREEDETPGWYHAKKDDAFERLGEHLWSKQFNVPEIGDRVPRIGLMLSGFLPNVAKIINPHKTRAIAHIDTKEATVYA